MGRGSTRPERSRSMASRAAAAAGSIGLEPTSPGGACSSHSFNRDQTSKPSLRQDRPSGRDLIAPIIGAAHAQPARPMASAWAKARSRAVTEASTKAASNISVTTRRLIACLVTSSGQASPAAIASPAAEGAQNAAGRTKANSSSTSSSRAERGGGARPRRRAVIDAWASSTGPCSKRRRASEGVASRPPRLSASAARSPGRTTRAAARSRMGVGEFTGKG